MLEFDFLNFQLNFCENVQRIRSLTFWFILPEYEKILTQNKNLKHKKNLFT